MKNCTQCGRFGTDQDIGEHQPRCIKALGDKASKFDSVIIERPVQGRESQKLEVKVPEGCNPKTVVLLCAAIDSAFIADDGKTFDKLEIYPVENV